MCWEPPPHTPKFVLLLAEIVRASEVLCIRSSFDMLSNKQPSIGPNTPGMGRFRSVQIIHRLDGQRQSASTESARRVARSL